MVRTYCGPVPDSEVKFYDTAWNELPAADFVTLPEENEFYKSVLSETASDSLRNLRLNADMYLKEVRLSDKDLSLSVSYTTPQYMDKTTADKLKSYLINAPIVYTWSNGKFLTYRSIALYSHCKIFLNLLFIIYGTNNNITPNNSSRKAGWHSERQA